MEEFTETCDRYFFDRFSKPYDVIVADNATIHNDFKEMLLDYCRVLVVFLPTRTPEKNPKEIIWVVLVKRSDFCITPLTKIYTFPCTTSSSL